MKLIYKFEELNSSKKVKEVGGKNASLGEMYRELGSKGINVPDGYATSADAYWKFIRENKIEDSFKGNTGFA
jgi:pyruvate, water dikinase